MKLYLNLPNHLQLEISVVSDFNFSEPRPNTANNISKIKQRIIKLYPHHWFDGIWDTLDYKM